MLRRHIYLEQLVIWGDLLTDTLGTALALSAFIMAPDEMRHFGCNEKSEQLHGIELLAVDYAPASTPAKLPWSQSKLAD